jgi:CubicO group peptidase (beta-lactamase class C family)
MAGRGWSDAGLTRLHDAMARHVGARTAPGIVTGIARDGDVRVDPIGALAFDGPAVHRDTIFRISSMTKPVTAVATMILVEECRLRLDDPVDDFLPELADRRVLRRVDGPLDETDPAERPITTRDLLTFTFGLGTVMAAPGSAPILDALGPDFPGQGPPNPARTTTPDEYLKHVGSLPLVHQPGARWMYNAGADVLGVLVARVAGQPFPEFLRARIFEPLGMRDTGFSVPPAAVGRLATSYATDPATGAPVVFDEAAGGQWTAPPPLPAGGGGLVSTVDDFLAFGQMLLDGGRRGRERILSRPSVAVMTTNQLTPAQKQGAELFLGASGWGFGMAATTVHDDVFATPGRYGWDGGLGTSWANDPAEGVVGVLMTQAAWDTPRPPAVRQDFWTATYAAFAD